MLLGLMLSGAVSAADSVSMSPGAVVATVNGAVITREEYRIALETAVRDHKIQTQVEEALSVVDDLINQEILAQQALELGLDEQPEVRAAMQLRRRELLADAYIRHYRTANPTQESRLLEIYEQQKDVPWPKRLKLRVIVFNEEAMARRVVKAIDSVEGFTRLARRYSIASSRKAGGLLGWLRLKDIPAQARVSVAALGAGQWLEEPLEIDGRWHIYLMEKIRRPTIPPFAHITEALGQYTQRQQVASHILKLRKEAKVEIPSE
ncbi:MAG: peptidylprolyl isomerase [Gammaproteobacteria bacterium]